MACMKLYGSVHSDLDPLTTEFHGVSISLWDGLGQCELTITRTQQELLSLEDDESKINFEVQMVWWFMVWGEFRNILMNIRLRLGLRTMFLLSFRVILRTTVLSTFVCLNKYAVKQHTWQDRLKTSIDRYTIFRILRMLYRIHYEIFLRTIEFRHITFNVVQVIICGW